MVATRFAYDYGWYHEGWSFAGGERRNDFTTLWYAQGSGYSEHDGDWGVGPSGQETSLVVALEPLTHDRARWLEVPEYAMLVAHPGADGALAVETLELDLLSAAADVLASLPLFAGLPAETLERVAALSEPFSIATGDPLFEEGEPANAVFILATGHVESPSSCRRPLDPRRPSSGPARCSARWRSSPACPG